MKKITSIIAIGILSIAFSTTASAQVSASAPTSTTIVTPIAISNTIPMNFGNFATTPAIGTIVLKTDGGRTKTGGVTLPGKAGTVAAAKFKVDGQADYTYAVTMPTAELTLTLGLTANKMIVNAFNSTTLNNSGTLAGVLTLGTDTVSVGATLNVGASQVAGLYENGTGFAVTVNYN